MSPEASAALQVRATQDYCNNYDLTSLNVKAGDIITVRMALGLLEPGCSPHMPPQQLGSQLIQKPPCVCSPHLIWPGP